MDSLDSPCSCWVPVEGLPLADVKGLLAMADLSVQVRDEGGGAR